MPYSSENDMLLGNIPAPMSLKTQYLNLATDEIDSVIGLTYETPVDVTDSPTNPVKRPARLLLKNISIWLSSGRLMLATSANGEDDQLHAYAKYLVDQATSMLMKIGSGEVALDDAPKNEEDVDAEAGALIYNIDPESNVEAFYDRIYMAPLGYPTLRNWSGG